MLDDTRIFNHGERDFFSKHLSINSVLADHALASLGDAFVNFLYSLALTKKQGTALGKKVDSLTLSSALKDSGLRRLLPARIDRHKQADAAEAIIVYSWLVGVMSLNEAVSLLSQAKSDIVGFKNLLQVIRDRLSSVYEKT